MSALWQRRRLIVLLARKDFFVKYRRASFGVLWAAALPILQAAVLSLIGARALHVHTGRTSYPLFVFTGVVGYSYFASTIAPAATAIVDNASLASKIYFPRAVMVLAAVGANAYSASINLALLLILAAGLGAAFGAHTLLLVPATILLLALTAALALLLAGLHVYFRDIRFMVQAALTVLMFLTPVFYPLHAAPHAVRALVVANPLTGVVELFRAAIGGADGIWPVAPLITLAWVTGLAVAALVVHCKRDRVFADLL